MEENQITVYDIINVLSQLAIGVYFARCYFRISKVRAFALAVLELAKQHDLKNVEYYYATRNPLAFDWFYCAMPSWARLIFSFKELTLENWFSQELINKVYDHELKLPANVTAPACPQKPDWLIKIEAFVESYIKEQEHAGIPFQKSKDASKEYWYISENGQSQINLRHFFEDIIHDYTEQHPTDKKLLEKIKELESEIEKLKNP